MATDATGTPSTNYNIPKYATSADAPSGKGFNSAIDFIDNLLKTGFVNKPSGAVTNDVPVWNGTTWVRPSGTPDNTTFLRGDGTWAAPSGGVTKLYDSVDAGVSLPTASITTPALSQSYRHLEIVVTGRSAVAAVNDALALQFNADTGANYDFNGTIFTGATINNLSGAVAATRMVVANLVGATSTANYPSNATITIPDYTGTTFYKQALATGGLLSGAIATTDIYTSLATGWWRNTAAITSIKFFPTSANFTAGTRITIYGKN